LKRPDASPTGKLNAHLAGASVARHLPEGAIVCDDSECAGVLTAPPALLEAGLNFVRTSAPK